LIEIGELGEMISHSLFVSHAQSFKKSLHKNCSFIVERTILKYNTNRHVHNNIGPCAAGLLPS